MGEINVTTSGPQKEKINEDEQVDQNPDQENLIQKEEVDETKKKQPESKLKHNIKPKPVPKPEHINLQKIKKINFKGQFDLENEVLLGIKKKNLEYEFNVLEEQTKKQKNIYEKIEQNEDINNKEILKEGCCCCTVETYLSWNFKLIGPLFVIFHLVGVFQLINLLESTQQEMIFGIKSFLFEDYNRTNQNMTFNNSTDINYQFENLCFKKIPDFNLLFLTSIIGNLFLKWLGYKFSSAIFMVVNSVAIIIYNSFNFPEEKYDNFYSVLFIILYYIILFISVGSMALFSQQIYFDGLKKYFIAVSDDEKKAKNKSYFSYLCFTAFPSYFIYIGINYYFKDYYYQNFFLMNIYVYSASTGVSIIIYFFYSFAFIAGEKILKEDVSKKYCRICGYLIYIETKKLKAPDDTHIKMKYIKEYKDKHPDDNIQNEENNIINDSKVNDDTLINENNEEKKEEEKKEEEKAEEDIVLNIDIGESNISVKNSNFVIKKIMVMIFIL